MERPFPAVPVHRCHGNETLALKLAEQATVLNGRPHAVHYDALIQSGRSEEVFGLAEKDPWPSQYALALADMIADRPEEAVARYEPLAAAGPTDWNMWACLANALAVADRTNEARDAVDRVRSILPTWSVELQEKGQRLAWRHKDEVVEALVAGLRRLEVE